MIRQNLIRKRQSVIMNHLYIIMYHYTRDLKHSRYPNIKGLDISLFREQLCFIKENFNIITMDELIAASRGHYELPERAVLLTFDDGYTDNYTFAFPLLEEMNIAGGGIFVPGKPIKEHKLLDVNKIHYILASGSAEQIMTDLTERMDYYRGSEFEYPDNKELYEKYAVANRFDTKETVFIKRMLQTVLPERARNLISSDLFAKYLGVSEEQLSYELYLTEEQIRTMKRHGMHIGIHGYDHYWLGNLSEEKMKRDIDRALDALGEFIDHDCWVMNYPYGNYNKNVVNYAKSRGASVGLSTEVRVADLGRDDLLALPRLDCNDFPPKSNQWRDIDNERYFTRT